jgi:hypothetical protein
MSTVRPIGERLEMAQIRGKPPWKGIAAADDIVLRRRHHQLHRRSIVIAMRPYTRLAR